MRRFFAREFALLCLPVAIVAGVGWWATHRPAPEQNFSPKFSLSYEPPSALKAFEGAKTVIVAKLNDDSQGNAYMLDGTLRPKYWLEATTSQGTKIMRDDGTGSLKLEGTSMSVSNNQWYYFYLTEVPAGDLTFGIRGKAIAASTPSKVKPHLIDQKLSVDKSKLQKFDFSLPRAPLVKIKSATISQVTGTTGLNIRLIIVLQGTSKVEDINVQTDFEEPHGYANATMTRSDPKNTRNFIIDEDLWDGNGMNEDIELTGRISAANRWPLAFAIEPFDFSKAKGGQKLKFKSWPAPLPPGALKRNQPGLEPL